MSGLEGYVGRKIKIFFDDLANGGLKDGVLISVSVDIVEIRRPNGQIEGIARNKIVRYEILGSGQA